MPNLIHGGDVYTDRHLPAGTKLVDFSANLNPLGMPEGVRQALIQRVEDFERYPDPFCRELRKALSEKEGISESHIVCGNGAADLIYRLVWALKPKKAILPAPTFAEYGLALESVQCEVEPVFLLKERGFCPGEELIQAVRPGIDLLFFCNPNNPTGITADKAYLLKLLERCRECKTLLVVDECFLDFVDGGEASSLRGELASYENLLLLKAFTKLYAMAGLRLGYLLCGSLELGERVASSGQAWSVSTPAQVCGLAALRETDYAFKTREALREDRSYLRENFETLGFHVYGSTANYLFFQTDWDGLGEKLLQFGILLRSCANYPGLDDSYYRAAVRTFDENRYLVRCLLELYETEFRFL